MKLPIKCRDALFEESLQSAKELKTMYGNRSLNSYKKSNQKNKLKSTPRGNFSIANHLISNYRNKFLYKKLLLFTHTTITCAACLGLSSLLNPVQAQIIRNYTPRYRVETRGQTVIFGNSVMTCSTTIGSRKSICSDARQGLTSGSNNSINNVFYMDYIDIDSDANTFNSSSADYNFPASSTILWAGLYWTGDTSGGNTANSNPAGTPAIDANKKNQMLFKLPGDLTYRTITADNIDITGSRYSSFADVTNLVKQSGSGRYFGANIQTGKGEDRFGGWTLIVVYEDPTQILRSMTIFDGFAAVSSSTPIITYISGFLTPPSGNFETAMGTVAYEGDVGLTGDQFFLDGDGTGTSKTFVAVSDSLNPITNFFNSSNTFLGTRVSAKNPDYPNLLGMDMDIVHAVDAGGNRIMQNGATSAGLRFTSSGDVYYPTAFTFSIEVFQPVLTRNFTKKVIDVNGGDVNPSDVLEYEITYTNTGNDAARDVIIQDPIPANTTFVSGSLEIVADPETSNIGLKTDTPGDDEAEFNSATNTVIFRSGVGANGSQGGEIGINQSVTLRFRVRVNPGVSSFPTTISNQARVDYKGTLTSTTFNGVSDDPSTPTSNDATNVNVVKPPVTISGTLYEDTDGGDDFDNGEATLPANITVKLLDTNNSVVATTTTAANGTYTFTNVTNGNYIIQVDTSDPDIPSGYTLGTPNNLAVTVSGNSVNNQNFGFDRVVASNPNVLLVKRITAINGSSFTDLIDGINDSNSPNYVPTPRDTDDNNANWPANYLQGLINGGTVRPKDEIEYTIYFLSAGDATAPKVLMCDRIPNNVTFIPTAFNNFATKNNLGLPTADRGIVWQYNGNTESLTNIKDGDVAQYFPPREDPTDVYPTVDCGGENTNGAIVVNLGDLPNATASGTPTNSYGFIRFRGRVK